MQTAACVHSPLWSSSTLRVVFSGKQRQRQSERADDKNACKIKGTLLKGIARYRNKGGNYLIIFFNPRKGSNVHISSPLRAITKKKKNLPEAVEYLQQRLESCLRKEQVCLLGYAQPMQVPSRQTIWPMSMTCVPPDV